LIIETREGFSTAAKRYFKPVIISILISIILAAISLSIQL